MVNTQEVLKKWGPVLDHESLPKIKENHKRAVTAVILENTEKALLEAAAISGGQSLLSEDAPTNNMGAGQVSTFDPV